MDHRHFRIGWAKNEAAAARVKVNTRCSLTREGDMNQGLGLNCLLEVQEWLRQGICTG